MSMVSEFPERVEIEYLSRFAVNDWICLYRNPRRQDSIPILARPLLKAEGILSLDAWSGGAPLRSVCWTKMAEAVSPWDKLSHDEIGLILRKVANGSRLWEPKGPSCRMPVVPLNDLAAMSAVNKKPRAQCREGGWYRWVLLPTKTEGCL